VSAACTVVTKKRKKIADPTYRADFSNPGDEELVEPLRKRIKKRVGLCIKACRFRRLSKSSMIYHWGAR
jgi:hypothetical protein